MTHQPSKSNEEVAQALMMKTAQQGGLHTRDIIKALQDKDADRERAVEEVMEVIEPMLQTLENAHGGWRDVARDVRKRLKALEPT